MTQVIMNENLFYFDNETGEVINPEYDSLPMTRPSKADLQFYHDTAIAPHDCKDLDRLLAFQCATESMRGVSIKSKLTMLKKESDYGVITLGYKPAISKSQYETLQKLASCVVYLNIILMPREDLCKALGVRPNHLARKLKQVEAWVEQKPAHVGWVRLFINPFMGFKGRKVTRWENKHTLRQDRSDDALYEHLLSCPINSTPVNTHVSEEVMDELVEFAIAMKNKKKTNGISVGDDYDCDYTID